MAVTAVRCGSQETKERARTRAKAKGRGRGKLNTAESSNLQEGWSETGAQGDEHADGWTWSGEHVDGWWMTANDQTPWDIEEPIGGFEINSTERCWSKNPRRGKEQRVRRWQQ